MIKKRKKDVRSKISLHKFVNTNSKTRHRSNTNTLLSLALHLINDT